ncbi:MAG: hypothetical protein HN573_03260, partial [Candidatus Marinimicrobia bacterium]|nr:hypothetical protein [Candidatus Neomarinimicrobiota bacterium]
MKKPIKKNKKQLKRKSKAKNSSSFIWLAVLFFVVMSLSLLPNESANEVEISYNTYKELLSDNKIKEASIENDNSFHGELLVPATLINKNGAEFTERTFFVVYLPSDYTDQIKIWDEKSIEYNFEGDKIDWTRTLIGFAPWLLLIAFWIFMIRRMQGSNSGMNNVFSFGKSKAKMFS